MKRLYRTEGRDATICGVAAVLPNISALIPP